MGSGKWEVGGFASLKVKIHTSPVKGEAAWRGVNVEFVMLAEGQLH